MVEDALGEGSAWCELSQVLGETERFSDWQVWLDNNKRSSWDWLFTYDNSSSLGKALIDTSHSIIRGLDFAQEDGFLESWLGSEESSVVDSSGSGDDLSTTSVNSLSVQCDVHNVESNTSHVFFCHAWLFGGPLEGGFHGVSDFVQVLDGLGLINEKVGSWSFRSEGPNLEGIILIPTVFFR